MTRPSGSTSGSAARSHAGGANVARAATALDFLENHFGDKDYLLASGFSAADIMRVIRDNRAAIAIVTIAPELANGLELVRELVSRVFVLDFGTVIASGSTDRVFDDSAVRRAYLGDVV